MEANNAAEPIPRSKWGSIDIRQEVPAGCIHVPGERLGVTCKAIGIDCVPAIVGWNERRRWSRPLLDGVVIRAEDEVRLREALERRDQRRLSPEQKARRKERDHERRLAQFASDIRREFPAMPEEDLVACARHATVPSSRRVGRSSYAEDRAQKAVVAYARHVYTGYDGLLDEVDRDEARHLISHELSAIIGRWIGGS